MKAQCIEAVTQAIGRKLNSKEVLDIEGRITRAMTQIAKRDPDKWRQLTRAQQLDEAANKAATDLSIEAERRKANVARQALAVARNERAWRGYVNEGRSGASAMFKLFEDVDRDIRGVRQQYFTELLPVLNYMSKASRWLGWKHDQPMLNDLVREIFGDATGNAEAKAAAKSWLDTAEATRQRFNTAGGEVGKLDYSYMPQPHNTIGVLKAGAKDWIEFTLPKLDRSRYLTAEGRPFSDNELRQFLAEIYDTIAMDGLNKMKPSPVLLKSSVANLHAAARHVHFADADSYLRYMARFGKGNPVSAMMSHINSMSRDIAMVERLGPNAAHTSKLLLDKAKKADGGVRFVGPVTAEQGWNTLTGAYNHPVNVRWAEIAQGIRNITTAVKLQGSFLSSFTDTSTVAMSAHYNKLPVFKVLSDMPKALGKDYREYANRVGLMTDSLISDMNRWADGHNGAGWTSKLADMTMKATLLTGWTDALKRAFSVNMMAGLGKLSRSTWSALDDADRKRLARAGITQDLWEVWRLAKPENWRGSTMLTAQSVADIPDSLLQQFGNPRTVRDRAITRLLGYIADEADTAVTSPDLMGRTIGAQGTQKGTIGGEVWRSLWLFKTFAVSILSRQLRRIKDINDTMGRGAALSYGAGLMSSLTILGGLSLQAKDMVTGKDPRPIDNPRFWSAAFLQGGGLGIFGDILYTALGGNSRGGLPNWASFAGPVFGTGFDLANLSMGNLSQAAEGRDTNTQAELIRFTRQNLPAVNLWYAKGAIDHFFVNNLLEEANPGYLRRMKQRAQKEWGQDYWWAPNEKLPERAPDLGAVVAQ